MTIPIGFVNVADAIGPSANPTTPVPAYVVTTAPGTVIFLILLFAWSVTYKFAFVASKHIPYG